MSQTALLDHLQSVGVQTIRNTPCPATATFLAMGLPRGGTTMLAAVLSAIGVPLPGDLGANREGSVFGPAMEAGDRDAVADIVSSFDAQYPIWAVKRPMMFAHLPLVEPLVRNPRLIVVVRDPVAVASRRVVSRGEEFLPALEDAARRAVKLIMAVRASSSPAFVVSYEKALQYPEAFVRALASFCGLNGDDQSIVDAGLAAIQNGEPTYLLGTAPLLEAAVSKPDVVPERGKGMASMIEGKGGWLFLGDDSNGSVRQYRGEVKIGTHVFDAWDAYFRCLDNQAAKHGFTSSFMVAPSKESVYGEYYPHERSSQRPIDAFLDRYPWVRYPTDILYSSSPFTSYSKTDTHFNDLGALIALRDQLASIGIEFPAETFEFIAEPAVGDLGNKCQPNRASETATLAGATVGDHRIRDNLIHNHGRMWTFENAASLLDNKCVLLGDSYSVASTKILSRVFRRLVYAHSVSLPLEIFEAEKPDVVLCEVAERFIPRAPEDANTFSFQKVIEDKILQLPASQRAASIRAQLPLFDLAHLSSGDEESSPDLRCAAFQQTDKG